MDVAGLRGRLQPLLLQDFDAVRDEFIVETGDPDPRVLVAHLVEWGLIPNDAGRSVLAALDAELDEPTDGSSLSGLPRRPTPMAAIGWIDEDDEDPEDATAVMRWDDGSDVEAPSAFTTDEVDRPLTEEEDPDSAEDQITALPVVAASTEFRFDDDTTSSEVDIDAATVQVGDRQALLERLGVTPKPAPSRSTHAPEASAPVAADASLAESGKPSATPAGVRRARFRQGTGGLRQTGGWEETPATAKRAADLPRDPRGRYQFVRTLGEGAMGRVFLAIEKALGRSVAFKEMNSELKSQRVLSGRFAAEARITAQLDHPGIVPVYSLEGDDAYTMKVVEGQTLADRIAEARGAVEARRPPPSTSQRNRLLEHFVQVCDAVAYAHARGVLHRDLKPENIMIGTFGETTVMDWGIARLIPGVAPERPIAAGPFEDEGELIIGTPGYMSPEQARGENASLGARSDQYALGLMLFEILSLQPAVTGKNNLALVTRQQEGEVDALVAPANDRISRELRGIVKVALAFSPANRYPTVADLAEDLRRALRGEAVLAAPDGLVTRVARVLVRRRELTLAIVGLLLLATLVTASAGIGLAQWQVSRALAEADRAAQADEAARTLRLTTASRHASMVDGHLLKAQGLLSVASTTTTDALRFGAAPSRAWFQGDFASKATAPADADLQGPGTKYGPGLVSAEHPVFVVAAGAHPDDVASSVARLAAVAERHFPRLLLRSHSEQRATAEGMLRRTVLDVRIPAAWVWVGLENGVYVSYPGHAGFADGFDPRLSERWTESEAAPRWWAAAPHPTGKADVLSVTQALYGEHDARIGVAGLDLSVPWARDTLLVPTELGSRSGVFGVLLDVDGAPVLDSRDASEWTPPVALIDAMRTLRSGTLETADGWLVFNRLGANGWTHVLGGADP